MFERLTDRFQDAFKSLTGRGRLTEENISAAMREVRRALLEADVNYEVAKEFVSKVNSQCLGEKVLNSVAPGQQAVKVVSDELTALLGDANEPLDLDAAPAVIMLVGLHGSGKTTTAAKLALHLRDKLGRKPLLAAADLYRPAAVDQLEILGKDLGIQVYSRRDAKDVSQLAVDARNQAQKQGEDVVIIDTAGRLQIDTDLVQELVQIKRRAQPREILLVADAALGQEAVSVAQHFDEALGITGIILTKLDGDARGGAALSMRKVTGRPIKFVGVGERTIDLEPFYPERMADRILGMGDVVSLVEKASEQYEEEEAQKLEEKLRKQTFDLEDFLDQISRIRKMGGLMSLMGMIPGMSQLKGQVPVDDSQFNRVEGIIHSMTAEERQNPDIIGTSRRRRISRGCGLPLLEVNQLLKQFQTMRQMMGKLGKMGGGAMEEMMSGAGGTGLGGLGGGLGGLGGGMPDLRSLGGFGGAGSKATKPKKEKRKKRAKNVGKNKKRKRK